MAGAKRTVTPTENDVRAIALSFEGVSEIDHWKRPAWRTTRRIFAVMRPDGLYLHLPEERKEFLFAADSETFVKYMWGKTANVILQIERVSPRELEALLREAWEYNKPLEEKSTAKRSARRPAARSLSKPADNAEATVAEIRRLALALPSVEEKIHFGLPSFRFGGRIFMQTNEKKNEAIFKLSPAHQEMLFETRPDAFRPEIWGAVRWTRIALSNVPNSELPALVQEAYDQVSDHSPRKAKASKKRGR